MIDLEKREIFRIMIDLVNREEGEGAEWGEEERKPAREKERVKQYANVGVYWSTSFNAHFHSCSKQYTIHELPLL